MGKLWDVAEEDFTWLLHGACVASLGVIIVINWRPQIGTCPGGLPWVIVPWQLLTPKAPAGVHCREPKRGTLPWENWQDRSSES